MQAAIAGNPFEDFQNVVALEQPAMPKTVKTHTPENTPTKAGEGPTHDKIPSDNRAPPGSANPPPKAPPAQAPPKPTSIAIGDPSS
jgi:hypothetical protein